MKRSRSGSPEQDRDQCRGVDDHGRRGQAGSPSASYPMISSAVLGSATGRAELRAAIWVRARARCSRGTAPRSRSRRSRTAAVTAVVRLSPVSAASSRTGRSVVASLILSAIAGRLLPTFFLRVSFLPPVVVGSAQLTGGGCPSALTLRAGSHWHTAQPWLMPNELLGAIGLQRFTTSTT
jgi:hypothetical protein